MADMQDVKQAVALMHRLADAASAAVLPSFRNLDEVESKGEEGFDPVTVADRRAEAVMRGLIEEVFPDDGIIGEEYGMERAEADAVWVLDPIDGTRAFIAGLPSWGTLIARMSRGIPRVGMMAQPFIGERFWSDGEASYWSRGDEEARLSTRECPVLADATLFATSPTMFRDDQRAAFDALASRVKTVRFGTDCYGYAMVAAGHGDIVFESGIHLYDVAPFVPILETAGGQLTSWNGGPAASDNTALAVGDPALIEEIRSVILGG
ncbi:histidinol phosphatase-like enzyme (inositol monophosphatase family) [Amorphus suaedae]